MRYRYLVLITMTLMLGACFSDREEVEAYVEDVKKNSLGNVTPLPPVEEYKTRNFTATSIRSPFTASAATAKLTPLQHLPTSSIKQQPRPDANRPRQFLEDYPLSSFIMVGILSKTNFTWALVKDDNGMVHAVKVGDYIGQNSGRITQITAEQIKILETVPDGAGGWMHTQKSLKLVIAPPEEEGDKASAKSSDAGTSKTSNTGTDATSTKAKANDRVDADKSSSQVTILPNVQTNQTPGKSQALPTLQSGSSNGRY